MHRTFNLSTISMSDQQPICSQFDLPLYGESGSKLTVRVTVSVFVTLTLVTVAVTVFVASAGALVIRHEQAEVIAGGPKPSEMLIWRLRTGSSTGQAAS